MKIHIYGIDLEPPEFLVSYFVCYLPVTKFMHSIKGKMIAICKSQRPVLARHCSEPKR